MRTPGAEEDFNLTKSLENQTGLIGLNQNGPDRTRLPVSYLTGLGKYDHLQILEQTSICKWFSTPYSGIKDKKEKKVSL